MYSLTLLVLVVAAVKTTVLSDTIVATTEETSYLRRKVVELESPLADYQNFFQRHDSTLIDQRSLLIEQDARISRLERLLHEQKDSIARQDVLVRQQDAKISKLKLLLLRQEKITKHVQAGHDECMVKLHALTDRFQALAEKVSTCNKFNRRKTSFLSDVLRTSRTMTLQQHDVLTRSDDAGPLEAVVAHLSQRVTDMNADMQSLRTATNADVQALKSSSQQQDKRILDAHTSTFIHWGSSTCSNGSQLVYSGVVGGSLWNDPGAAANYLCLTMSPLPPANNHHYTGNHLYGAEYESNDAHDDMDAVCAVCRSSYATTIMIPGTTACTPGWHPQYSGYLMAGNSASPAASEFVCVDPLFQARPGSKRNDNGKQMYYVAAKCGSLPCEPYVENMLVTCVVCSK